MPLQIEEVEELSVIFRLERTRSCDAGIARPAQRDAEPPDLIRQREVVS